MGEESLLFARTLISHQKYFSHQITDLIHKLLRIVKPTLLLTMDSITLTLPPPRGLQIERESQNLQNLVALIQALEGLGIPKEYSKKKYLPDIDWNEIKKFETSEAIEKSTGAEKDTGGSLGGMGGDLGGGYAM